MFVLCYRLEAMDFSGRRENWKTEDEENSDLPERRAGLLGKAERLVSNLWE